VRRLFLPADELTGESARIDGEAHRHLSRVLRMVKGERLVIFDGQGTEIDAEIRSVGRDATLVGLGARRKLTPATMPRLVLLQGIARGERMDLIVQKTCELGVSAIVPVVASRSVPRLHGTAADARRARWEKIAREAARQCGRADVPAIAPPASLRDALAVAETEPDSLRLALWEESGGRSLRAALSGPPRASFLLVGPEGGWEEQEMRTAQTMGFEVVGLGPRILRAETAAVVAVALAQAAAGGLD
jgi:16S rRNA (uracil1498-N3)-methyltransferase